MIGVAFKLVVLVSLRLDAQDSLCVLSSPLSLFLLSQHPPPLVGRRSWLQTILYVYPSTHECKLLSAKDKSQESVADPTFLVSFEGYLILVISIKKRALHSVCHKTASPTAPRCAPPESWSLPTLGAKALKHSSWEQAPLVPNIYKQHVAYAYVLGHSPSQ